MAMAGGISEHMLTSWSSFAKTMWVAFALALWQFQQAFSREDQNIPLQMS